MTDTETRSKNNLKRVNVNFNYVFIVHKILEVSGDSDSYVGKVMGLFTQN